MQLDANSEKTELNHIIHNLTWIALSNWRCVLSFVRLLKHTCIYAFKACRLKDVDEK